MELGCTREQAIKQLEGPKCPYIGYEGQFDELWTHVERATQAIKAADIWPKPCIPDLSAYERAKKKLCPKKPQQ
jgi:hypothetical protein